MLRGFLLVTAGLAFMTSGAAAAEIVTVCTAPNRAALQPASALAPFLPSQAMSDSAGNRAASHGSQQIALSHDEKGYDILLNWQDSNEQSLRAAGAEIEGMELGPDFVHVLVSRDAESLEHFVFNLNGKGAGELLWSAEALGTPESVSSVSVCLTSHEQ